MLTTFPSRTRHTWVSSMANSRPEPRARPQVRPFSTTVSPATIGDVALADEAVTRHVANEEELLAPLTARKREQLVRITRKLLAHLTPRSGP